MGKKSRRHKSGASGAKKNKMPATRRHLDTADYPDENPRPYQELHGRVVTLRYVQSEKYRGKDALCVGYDDPTERLIVWPLETANEILVDPAKTESDRRYTVDDCRREIRERQSEERRAAARDDECSICLETPRAPVDLPCLHRFCGSCIARLRSPREEAFELRCPNCRARMPAMFEKLLVAAEGIVGGMLDGMVCSDPGCAKRHKPNGCLVTDDVVHHLKKMHDEAVEMNDITPFLVSLENYMRRYAEAATLGNPAASEVKAHRDIMRRMVCRVLPEVKRLRRQYEGCLQVRSTCGGIDSELEGLYLNIYGKPLLSPEEERAKLADQSSLFDQAHFPEADSDELSEYTASADGKMAEELTKMVVKNLDGAWCYIRSFGRYYDRVLVGFGNAVGKISEDPTLCKMLTDEMAVDSWAMRRLDAMEELLEKGSYGKDEAGEAFLLVQLLYNVIFPAVGEYQVQLDLFVRQFGQDYFLRELEGAIDPKAREGLGRTIGEALNQAESLQYTDEFNRPLLLLRPCANPRYGGIHPEWCQTKESRPNEFLRCKCKRMAYCSPSCMLLHKDTHAKACAEALRARERLGGA